MSDELLQPRSLDAEPPQGSPDPGGKGPAYLGLGLLVLLLGLGAIWGLSRRTPAPPIPQATPTPLPGPVPTVDPALRLEAETQLNAVLALLGPLRASEPERWAAERWQALQSGIQEGDRLLADQKYAEAATTYQSLLPELEALTRELPGLPEKLMPQARAAYAKGDKADAVGLLNLILYLAPGHAEASALLPRAENADQSFGLLKAAEAHASQKDWDLAWASLKRLEARDKDFPGAAALDRQVANEMSQLEFQKWMSQAVLALENQDLAAAEALIRKAVAFRPEDPSVKALQKQIADLMIQRQVLDLKARAEKLRQAEDWAGAHQLWLEMKSLDKEAPWIEEGLTRSLHWKLQEEKIKKGMADPGSAQTGVWAKEMQVRKEWPPGLDAQAAKMIAAWQLATTPVKVKLRSDAETRVELVQKGKWEPFVEKDLMLKPGRYIAKGWRLGYRDVRVSFEVKPGQQNLEVEVICREGLR